MRPFTVEEILEKDIATMDQPGILESTSPSLKFFIIAPPEVTTRLSRNQTKRASRYYNDTLNEESAEIWLHRGFERMTYDEGHTLNSTEADVFLVAGYLHLNSKINQGSTIVEYYRKRIVDPTKPHLLLMPSWNPGRSGEAGIKSLAKALLEDEVNLWSVGFERNKFWQGVSPDRIVPVPYVVRPSESRETLKKLTSNERKENFVFYSGDLRPNAKGWAGCHRDKLIYPLQNRTDMDVRLVGKRTTGKRLDEKEYNYRMTSSEYCLILCGDTPSSRSLASSIVYGCLPIRVGSRLRGLCEPPCQKGWGWNIAGPENSHLPFPDRIPWGKFPEVDEMQFTEAGARVLNDLFLRFDSNKKEEIRSVMGKVQEGFIYGWGDPVTSTDFGNAVLYTWSSFKEILSDRKK